MADSGRNLRACSARQSATPHRVAYRAKQSRQGGAVEAELSTVRAFVRAAAGPRLDDLVQAMLDYACPPMMLGHSHSPAFDAVYSQCCEAVQVALDASADATKDELNDALPWHLQGPVTSENLVEAATWETYSETPESIFEFADPSSRVLTAHPVLLERMDSDGLVDCTGSGARSQYFVQGSDALHYHQLLRRNFGAHINYPLIDLLLTVGTQPGNQLRLALDERRIMPASAMMNYEERDYWSGPPLTGEWLDDPHKVGCTEHGDPQAVSLMHEYPRFYAYWRMDKEGHKVAQLEELSGHAASDIAGLRVVRYLHAIRDIELGTFIHCDGAVRAYSPAGYAAREQERMPPRTRAARYRKVFRIDGRIATDDWSKVVASWFRGNFLTMEYLKGLPEPEGDAG